MKLTNKALSILLVLVMALSLLPVTALAAAETITEVAITYDTAIAFPTTRLTGKQVSTALAHAVTCSKSGDQSGPWYVYMKPNNGTYTPVSYTCLAYKDGTQYRMLDSSDEALNPEREYYFRFNVEDNGSNGVFDTENLPAVTINGAPADDVQWANQRTDGDIYAYQRVYLNETADCAWNVDLDPAVAVVQKGTTKQFTAAAQGTNSSVAWSVIGHQKLGTSMSNTGLLTVAADETATELTVRAYSAINYNVYADATVTVISEAVGISSVSLSPASADTYRSGSQQFIVTVEGTDVHDVEWTLTGSTPMAGHESDVSSISSTGTNYANVAVSEYETASTLTLRATSVRDNSKYAEATVNVLDRPFIENVAVTYNENAVVLGSTRTGLQITTELMNAVTCSKSGNESGLWYVYLRTNNGAYVPDWYTCLVKKNGSNYTELYNSEEALDPLADYYLRFNIENRSGISEFDPDQLPAVTVNGAPADDVRWAGRRYTGDIYAYKHVALTDVFQLVAQPQSVTAEVGEEVEFYVDFAGAMTYQWMESTDGVSWGGCAESGNTTATLHLTVSAATAAKQYRCYITGADAQTFTTDAVHITVPFEITTQPQDIVGTDGDPASFHVEAVGAASYQWQYSADEGAHWTNSPAEGNKTDTLNLTINEERTALRYRCRITSHLGQTLYTDTVRLYMLPGVDEALNVAGGALHFSNDATYPWLADIEDGVAYAYSGNAGYHNTESAITLSVNLNAKKILSFEYRVFGEGADGGSYYDYGALVVDGESSPYTLRRVRAEAWTEFAVEIPAGAHTLVWKYHKDGGTDGEGGDCFQLRRIRIADPTLTVSEQPENFVGGIGDTFTFHTAAIGNAPSYQWQYSPDGGAHWYDSPAAGNKTDTLTGEFTADRLANLYRCRITDSGSTVYTNAVRLVERELQILSNPSNIYVGFGEPFTFTVNASGSGLTYQWQIRPYNGEWSNCNLSGSKTATVSGTLTQARIDASFRCIVTDRQGNTLTSSHAYLYEKSLNIAAQPRDFCGALNDDFSFTVEAQGSVPKYQWQYSADGVNWSACAANGAKTATLADKITESRVGLRYRCVVTDRTGNTKTTSTVVLSTPGLRDQLLNAVGQNNSFTSTGAYPWLVRDIGGTLAASSGNAGFNSTESVLSIDVNLAAAAPVTFEYIASSEGSESGNIYDYGTFSIDGVEHLKRCEAENWTEFETGLAAGAHTLTWTFHKDGSQSYRLDGMALRNVRVGSAAPLAITAQPESVTATVGDTAYFTVTAAGDGLTYQWQYSNNGGTTWNNSPAEGNKTATLTVPATQDRNGLKYRCKVTDSHSSTLISDAATLTVSGQAVFAITVQPENVTAAVGDTVHFTVTATGDGLTYQWQYSSSGSTKWYNSPAEGNKTATLTVPATQDRSGNRYRCKVFDSHGSALTSSAATLTVTEAAVFAITAQPENVTANVGDTAHFTVAASGDGLKYQWQFSDDGGAKWYNSPAEGNKTATLTVPATQDRSGNKYRCKVTDSNGSKLTSDAAVLTVIP